MLDENQPSLFEEPTETPNWASRLAVFDLETTGLDLREARIVTACVVELDAEGNAVGEAREWLADPIIEIPEAASNVHGVTTEIARRDGRLAAEVVSEIVSALAEFFAAGVPVVAYNAPYDFTILHHEAVRHGLSPLNTPGPVIDPMVIDKKMEQYRKGKRTLTAVSDYYGVALSDAHNATADAIAAGRVAQAIAKKHGRELPPTAAELHDAQIAWSADQEARFAKWMQENNDPDFKTNIGWPVKP